MESMAAVANDQVSSEKENMLPNEISEEENDRFLRELPSSSSSSRRRIDFTNHMSANYLHFAVSRHWRSRSAPDNNLDSADWEMSPAKASKQGKEEYGKQLWHQNSNCRKKHLYLSGRRAALEHDVAQLQMQLQDEKFMRRDLEMAMGQASGALSPGHQHFVGQTMELMEEIYSLEGEVRGLEQRLLILYRNFFHEFLAASPSSQNTKMVPSASTDNDRKRERNTLSRVLFTPSKSPSSLGCSHISSATQSSHKENLQPLLKSRQDSFSSDLCSVDQRCHSLEHQNSPRMQEGDCKDLSTMNQNNAVPLTLKDYFYKSPNRLSEELVRCMSVIYCKLSDPPLRQSGIVLSPSSSVSSTSISSPHDAVSEGWSPRWKTQSFSDTPLKDPYKVKDDMGDAGPYSSMVEIPWICVDKDRLTYVTGMLRTFRSMVEHLEKVDPTPMERNAKLAFWINIYNALVMHAYLAYGIPRNNMRRMQLFQRASYKVGGHSISANAIEQSILGCKMSRSAQWLQALLSTGTRFKTGEERRTFGRTFGLDGSEPLVCFALCSGGFSDPAVRVYTEKNVYNELEMAKQDFLLASIGTQNSKKVLLPKLLEWYAKETAIGSGSLVGWVCQNVDEIQREAINKCVERKPHKMPTHCIEWLQYNSNFRYIFSRDLAVGLS